MNMLISKTIQLKPYQEYRVHVSTDEIMEVNLKEGTAEIFGAEMTTYKTYTFESDKKLAIYTWEGCKLEVKSNQSSLESSYEWECSESEENPMITYLNTHYYLNHLREEAIKNYKIGPKVLICGSSSSGKKSLSKILINYATKTGWKPIFADLDIISNEIGTPGTMGACVIDNRYPDYPDGLMENENKIIFWHGYNNYSQKKLYEEQIYSLSCKINEKLENNLKYYTIKKQEEKLVDEISKELNKIEKNVYSSGVIIKSPTYTEELGFSTYKNMIESLDVHIILVIDHDGLYTKLKKEFSKISIVKLNKSGGVVELDEKYKNKLKESKFSYYFDGSFKQIKSKIYKISFTDVALYAIIKNPAANYALPAGTTAEDIDKLRTKKIDPLEQNLTKKVLGVVHLKKDNEIVEHDNKFLDKLIKSPLSCIAYIKETDVQKKELTVMFPFVSIENSNAFQSYWLYSDMTWMG